jgi:hypothetical protein
VQQERGHHRNDELEHRPRARSGDSVGSRGVLRRRKRCHVARLRSRIGRWRLVPDIRMRPPVAGPEGCIAPITSLPVVSGTSLLASSSGMSRVSAWRKCNTRTGGVNAKTVLARRDGHGTVTQLSFRMTSHRLPSVARVDARCTAQRLQGYSGSAGVVRQCSDERLRYVATKILHNCQLAMSQVPDVEARLLVVELTADDLPPSRRAIQEPVDNGAWVSRVPRCPRRLTR